MFSTTAHRAFRAMSARSKRVLRLHNGMYVDRDGKKYQPIGVNELINAGIAGTVFTMDLRSGKLVEYVKLMLDNPLEAPKVRPYGVGRRKNPRTDKGAGNAGFRAPAEARPGFAVECTA